MNKDISLYIHIPFCIKRCSYCDFITHTDNSNELIEKYVDKICKEIEYYKNYNLNIKTIFIGGGTPSVLKIDLLEKIFQSIHKNFKLSEVSEITIEINPINLNRSNFKKYLNLGINRLSMGVQTFNDKVLKELNRNHSVKDIYDTYYFAKESGFNNFNLDLMFGLPNQTLDLWIDTLEKALELNSEHISLYCLDLHEDTPLFEYINQGIYSLPAEILTTKMFDYAKSYLKSKNYIHYEISNWSKENYQAKHNIVYWKNLNYIGIGVSAASFFNEKRYTNTKNLYEYINQEKFNLFEKTKKQSIQEQIEETIFMNLRLLNEGLDIDLLNQRFNINFLDYYKEEIEYLKSRNLVIIRNNTIKISDKNIFTSNEIFEKFLKN
ncbi:MAG: radical SAM family heme chaperone HemW [Candidatus Sericytochromatia bacterium]